MGLKHLYFVRHTQSDHAWSGQDRTRPLTAEGRTDAHKVTEALREIRADAFVASPYLRSVETVRECAEEHGLPVHTDERLRERRKGPDGNNFGMFRRRWADFDYAEPGGESLGEVQKRNMEAVFDLLHMPGADTIVVGTHGTALSTILNYFEPAFGCGDFLRIIDFMPYIVRLDFEGIGCAGKTELLIVKKEFKGGKRADKEVPCLREGTLVD